MTHSAKGSPSLLVSFIPLLVLMALLGFNIYLFGDGATGGANQIALLIAAAVAIVIGIRLNYTWDELQKGIVKSIKSSMGAILILLMIGALAGTWLISGIVPTMIYYGLKVLNPSVFLVAACVVSAIVSLATGSSWSTIATIGVALLGIGEALGMHTGMVAGAIISGAYFGDKMSPLSDTTNLAPAMAGTDLFTHIRYMMWTTIPTLILTLIIFAVFGFTVNTGSTSEGVDSLITALQDRFNLSPWLFLVPVLVIILIIKKMDALPALFIGTLLGGVFAMIFQPEIVKEVAGNTGNYFVDCYKALVISMSDSVQLITPNEQVNKLLSAKGMSGMLGTIWLIVSAMTFGGVLDTTGILKKITSTIVKKAKSTGSLIASTAGTCIFFNTTASDQYLAIVVPGRMYADTYRERGLAPENLSRTLEDSGTVTSVLIPWNTCAAAQASVLKVATGEYWMYCFFNILSPITTVVFAYFNIKIKRIQAEKA